MMVSYHLLNWYVKMILYHQTILMDIWVTTYLKCTYLDARVISKNAYKQLAHVRVDIHKEAQGNNDVVFELR
jgi:hypothetical protein